MKEICSPVLLNEISKDRTSKIVLQIQKIRNVSAPKANEESQAAPSLLKLSLTDGESYIQALELLPLLSISRKNTPPGSKILINNAKVLAGYLLLTPENCKLLGGNVPALVEKWELAKSIQNSQRFCKCMLLSIYKCRVFIMGIYLFHFHLGSFTKIVSGCCLF